MIKGTALITGINGFIGSHLSRIINAEKPDLSIVGVDRLMTPEIPGIPHLQVDLLDKEAISHAIQTIQPDYIFHLAGVIYSGDLQELYKGNVQSTVNLLESVKALTKPLRVIISGSAAEYGSIPSTDLPLTEQQIPNPVSPYGVSKVWQTTVARYYATQGVDVQIGRVFNVIGKGMPADLSIGSFASQLGKISFGDLPPRLSVGNLKPKRDFIDVEDVCRAFIVMAGNGRCGEISNICSGKSISVEDIVYLMIAMTKLDVEITIDPGKVKGTDINDIYGNNSKLTSVGWHINVPIEKSIEQIMASYLAPRT